MDTTHIHLLLNHFPVIGTLIGSGLLLLGILKKHDNIKTAASVILILMTVIAIPVYITGEPAEESVEKLPGVLDSMIELHEDAAKIAIWLMGLTGVFALVAVAMQRQKRHLAKHAYTFVFIFSLICFAAMARTGYYGGQIRHSEIRSGAAVNNQNEKGDKAEKVADEKEEDD